jgi:hypothetical protein
MYCNLDALIIQLFLEPPQQFAPCLKKFVWLRLYPCLDDHAVFIKLAQSHHRRIFHDPDAEFRIVAKFRFNLQDDPHDAINMFLEADHRPEIELDSCLTTGRQGPQLAILPEPALNMQGSRFFLRNAIHIKGLIVAPWSGFVMEAR